MPQQIQPLPCPFCGAVPEILPLRMMCGEFIVTCRAYNCPVTYVASDGWTEQQAIEKWNMRHTAKEPAK